MSYELWIMNWSARRAFIAHSAFIRLRSNFIARRAFTLPLFA
jgi:hypothetical protein